MNTYSGELCIDIHCDIKDLAFQPKINDFKHWLGQTLTAALSTYTPEQKLTATNSYLDNAEISINLVETETIQQLNLDYRGKNSPTNVLSFPTDFDESLGIPLLGDIVICPAILAREAQEQNKPLEAHWAHLSIHGCLHLLGFDHIESPEAEIMEGLETKIMLDLDFPTPYSE